MKKTLNYLVIAGSCLLGACTQADIPVPDGPDPGPSQSTTTRVKLADALKNADRLLELIEGPATRARTVKSVEMFGGAGTRSGESEDLYYVVNYDNDGGFAVLAADNRLCPVYAISEKGHLDMNDTTVNGGLNLFFRNLTKVPPFTKDTIDLGVYPLEPVEQKIDHSYKRGPLLTEAVQLWHQSRPFNFGCPGIFESSVGCAPLAMGQIMTYYEHPGSYQNTTYYWDKIKSWKDNSGMPGIQRAEGGGGLPYLLRAIGDELHTQYGSTSSTSMFAQYYQQTFQNFGYKRPADLKVYNSSKLHELVSDRKPVLLWGESSKTTSHVWVVDGLIFDYVEYRNSLGSSYSGVGTLFHCVWGQRGGSGNGYFKLDPGTKKYVQDSNGKWKEEGDYHTQYSKINYCGDFQPQ